MSGATNTYLLFASTWTRAVARRNADSERGAALVEYGLLIMLVALVAFSAIVFFGEAVVGLFEPGSSPVAPATTP